MFLKKLILVISLILIPLVCYGVPADMAVTPGGAGDGSGTAGDGTTLEWDNAMSEAQFEADMEANAEAGDRYYTAGGTYTLDSAYATAGTPGTVTANIQIIGVKSGTTNEPPVFSDWAFTTDRPVFAAAAFGTSFGAFWRISNIIVTTTEATGLTTAADCGVINVKATNSSGSADRSAIRLTGTQGYVLNSEGISTLGEAFHLGNGVRAISCYGHDSKVVFSSLSTVLKVINSVADTSITGIGLGATDDAFIVNNTLYNCTTGISGTTSDDNLIVNNFIGNCTTGVSFDSDFSTNFLDYNQWSFNTADTSTATKGNNAITGDISLGDPDGGNFTLPSGAASLDAGIQIGTNEGVVGDYKWNIGVDQDDNTAAGGGGGRRAGWSIQ